MEGPLVGVLRSWRDPWGFIVCPEAFEGDLFAHRESFVGGVPAGDLAGASVQFRRDADGKGRPRAMDIRVLQMGRPGAGAAPPAAGFAGKARTPLMPRRMPDFQQQISSLLQVPTSTRASVEKLASLAGQRMRGKVRSWKEQWGFISSAKFEGDLFVHRQNLQFAGEPFAGKPVSFSVAIDAKGRAAATEVTEPTAGPEDFEGAGQLSGRIRSWKNEWGFIVAPEHFEGDLFCHREHVNLDVPMESMAQAVVNCAVRFEVMTDSKGRTHAAKVVVLDPLPAHSAGGPGMGMTTPRSAGTGSAPEQLMDDGEVLHGTLRSWRDAWGFIVCPEKFEGDLFVHKDVFQGEAPHANSAGRPVQFQRAIDPRGRPHAIQVRLLGPAPIAAVASSRSAPQADPFGQPNGLEGGHVVSHSITSTNKYDHCFGMQVNGQCRSWKGEWGFVVSDAFEGDLFAHKMHMENGAESITPGAALTFEVGGDSKGRATALNIKCVSEAKDWAGSGVQLQGTVRSYREPWGFLVSPGSYTGDLFFHIDQVTPQVRQMMRSGLEVSFRVEIGTKERCTGVDIQYCPAGAMAASAAKRKAPSTPGPMQGRPKMPRF